MSYKSGSSPFPSKICCLHQTHVVTLVQISHGKQDMTNSSINMLLQYCCCCIAIVLLLQPLDCSSTQFQASATMILRLSFLVKRDHTTSHLDHEPQMQNSSDQYLARRVRNALLGYNRLLILAADRGTILQPCQCQCCCFAPAAETLLLQHPFLLQSTSIYCSGCKATNLSKNELQNQGVLLSPPKICCLHQTHVVTLVQISHGKQDMTNSSINILLQYCCCCIAILLLLQPLDCSSTQFQASTAMILRLSFLVKRDHTTSHLDHEPQMQNSSDQYLARQVRNALLAPNPPPTPNHIKSTTTTIAGQQPTTAGAAAAPPPDSRRKIFRRVTVHAHHHQHRRLLPITPSRRVSPTDQGRAHTCHL
ncbi:hypothetical protein Salat_2959300 [Sesamum alatum]|uniref:Uncharacterized protein n=1 Tax=Sesamum alatum TaxID=300844 RepID=A0AAE2C8Q3_9LAMI|nr:hypothetical protein Salat_2959300 [Sesamum alatum]